MINYANMKVLLESILVEDKLSDLQGRYKDIHPETIKDIWDNGVPSNNQGKYIDWSIKENNKSHNPSRTKQALDIYDRNKDRIGKFNHQWSINDLESVTHPFTDEGKSFNKKADEGTSIHYEDNDIIVRQHNNHESAVKAGFLHPNNDCYNSTNEPGKAQWCVSSNSEAGKSNFNDYTNRGVNPLYTIEDKKDKTKSAVVLNPNKSPELRDEYDKTKKPYEMIYRHPNIVNSELGNRLLNIGDTKEILSKVPANASESDLIKRLEDDNPDVRSAVVSHPKATEQVLLKGLENNLPSVKKAVLRHPKATEHVLLRGLEDDNPDVRSVALRHPKATEQMLLKGLNDNDSYVRSVALSHPKATEHVLLRGLEDGNPDVRSAVVSHPKVTEQMLLKGLDDDNSYVKKAVLRHPKATEHVLLRGLEDDNPDVRSVALRHPKVTEHVLLRGLEDDNPDVRGAVLSHPKATEHMLLRGLEDDNPDVRSVALRHPKVTEQMLLKGLDDDNKNVIYTAIQHPKATKKVLLKGLNNLDRYVADTAKYRLQV